MRIEKLSKCKGASQFRTVVNSFWEEVDYQRTEGGND